MMPIVVLQIVNGKLKQATFVWPRLTGLAVAFASLMRGCMKCTSVAEKARMLYGMPLSEGSKMEEPLKQAMDTECPRKNRHVKFEHCKTFESNFITFHPATNLKITHLAAVGVA